MLYNHKRQLVDVWDEGQESLCPECLGPLIARKGSIKIHHWAHKSNEIGCASYETDWHLAWKFAFLDLPGWTVEKRMEIDGQVFIFDAFNERTKLVREFVHSLSDKYLNKHLTLKNSEFSCTWIWDGEEFKSAYSSIKQKELSHYYKDLLKPKAFETFTSIGDYVHYRNTLLRHWKSNIWFTIETAASDRLCTKVCQLLKKAKTEGLHEH